MSPTHNQQRVPGIRERHILPYSLKGHSGWSGGGGWKQETYKVGLRQKADNGASDSSSNTEENVWTMVNFQNQGFFTD